MICSLPNENEKISIIRDGLSFDIYSIDIFRSCYKAKNFNVRLPDSFDIDYLATLKDQKSRDLYIGSLITLDILNEFRMKIVSLVLDSSFTLAYDSLLILGSGIKTEIYDALIFVDSNSRKWIAFDSQNNRYLKVGVQLQSQSYYDSAYFFAGDHL